MSLVVRAAALLLAVTSPAPRIDKEMRETIVETAKTFLFIVDGVPCTPTATR